MNAKLIMVVVIKIVQTLLVVINEFALRGICTTALEIYATVIYPFLKHRSSRPEMFCKKCVLKEFV